MRTGILRRLTLLSIGLIAWTGVTAATSVSVKDLITHGEQYHQQPVSVVGKAEELKTLNGPRSLPFYTFILQDHGVPTDSVTVIMQGKPEVSNGDQVFVHGVFIKSRKAGRSTITNRIEAIIVNQLHDHRQPFIG
jgi:hypothetical protein